MLLLAVQAWIPAFAGMTTETKMTIEIGLTVDMEVTVDAKMIADERNKKDN